MAQQMRCARSWLSYELTKLQAPSRSPWLLQGCSARHRPGADVVGTHNDGERFARDDSGVIQSHTRSPNDRH
jgi:hypothetical protein